MTTLRSHVSIEQYVHYSITTTIKRRAIQVGVPPTKEKKKEQKKSKEQSNLIPRPRRPHRPHFRHFSWCPSVRVSINMAKNWDQSLLRHTLPFLLLPVLCLAQLVQCKAVSVFSPRINILFSKERQTFFSSSSSSFHFAPSSFPTSPASHAHQH